MYTGWQCMPKKGYNMIPEIFWMWDRASKNRIENWASNSGAYKVVTFGNPWIAVNNHGLIKRKKTEDAIFLKKENRKKFVILLALQPFKNITECFPDFLQRFIHENDQLFWAVRKHPRMIIKDEELSHYFDGRAFDIEQSTQLQLFDILPKIDIVFTYYSTVAFEAHYFKKKVVIIHPEGKKVMSEMIKSGDFKYAETVQDLHAAITEEPHVRTPNSFTNIDLMRFHLKRII
ncbi:MAG: hypothetical protein AAF616_13695 [Bacteroidota bacterium]